MALAGRIRAGRASDVESPGRRSRRLASFADLPLSWKLLVPSLALIVVLGAVGGFVVVRDLSARSQATVDLELSRRSLDARAVLRDQELALLESANLAANLDGMVAALRRRDRTGAARLLQSVVALKTELELAAVVDVSGRALTGFLRDEPGVQPRRTRDIPLGEGGGFVGTALHDQAGARAVGLTPVGGRTMIAVAAPVCSDAPRCEAVGAAVLGFGIERLAVDVLARVGNDPATAGGLTLFDADGRVLAAAGTVAPREGALGPKEDARRVSADTEQGRVATLYAPFEARGERVGSIAVAISVDETLGSVRRTAFGLGLVLLAAIAGLAGIGLLLSRLILRQIRSLVETNRALGRGDLSARAHVEWNDELGELAARANEMAEQLQAMYETLELRVAQRTEEVERLLRERTEFFATVSHELRTPLAVILRHSEMLRDPEYRKNGRFSLEAGKALEDSGGQLGRLIDDILELAAVESGGLEIDPEPTDLPALVKEMRRTIDPLARSAGLRVTYRIPARIPVVMADPRRLRQVVLNLVDNAVKYTPEGGEVTISAEARAPEVVLRVADDGVGIPGEYGDRIFEPFYRVKGVRTQGGQASSGLGLAVAKRLVDAHGGELTYQSREGGGTVFEFTLRTAERTTAGKGTRGHDRDA